MSGARKWAPEAHRRLFAAATRIDSLRGERFVRFLLVGAMNTLFGYAVFCAALAVTGRSVLSLAVSWIIGAMFNFRTTGRLVFGSTDLRLVTRFVSVYVAVFSINAASLRALESTGLASALAAAILTPFMAVLSYLAMRDFVFSDQKDRAA